MSYAVRRTRRGRSSRSRRRRRVGFVLVVLLFLSVAAIAALRIASSHLSSSESVSSSAWTRGNASANLAGLAAQAAVFAPSAKNTRVIYPYSVVPGGVQSSEDLKQASDHDPLVAQHYAGFDYQHAKVIEVREPRLVYLSYRLHNRIYWTSRLIRLHRGEKLISDGKMTARTRCGNRVSEAVQKAVSPEEPPAEKFDQPYMADGGTATQAPFPGTFASTLRSAPAFDGMGPGSPPLTSSYLFGPGGGGGYPPIFPPPIPINAGSCNATNPGSGSDPNQRNCPKKPGPGGNGPPPPVVPEPGTIFLISSGAVGIYLRYRKAK